MPWLALVPLRDWLWAAALVAVLVLLAYERHEGKMAIIAADRRTAMVAEAKDQAIEAAAQSATNTESQIYEKAVAVTPVGDIGILCHAPARGVVPATPAGAAAAVAPAADGAAGPQYDPSGAILTIGAKADAQITYLQNRIKILEDLMNQSP
jgi:hypothetical protein